MNFTESLWATGANVSLGADGAVEDEGEPLYEVPTAVVVLLSLCYGSVSVLAVAGNALVMWVVATSRRMQNVTNCFIANLALADIVIGLFAIPFQFQAALLQRWSLPAFMCPFCPFVRVLSVNVSVFTLTAIAVDRHRAILHPLGTGCRLLSIGKKANEMLEICWRTEENLNRDLGERSSDVKFYNLIHL